MAIFRLLWPKEAIFATKGIKYSILKQKTWSKIEQTLTDMCFDTALQMKIVYIGLVIILWKFLAFYGQNGFFATKGTEYSILKQKTRS